MKTKILALFLLMASPVLAGGFFFGFGGGSRYYRPGYGGYYARPYYAPAPVYVAPPPYYAAPVYGPAYSYYGGNYGYPPFGGAIWYGPRYYGGHYYRGGYWGHRYR